MSELEEYRDTLHRLFALLEKKRVTLENADGPHGLVRRQIEVIECEITEIQDVICALERSGRHDLYGYRQRRSGF